LKRYGFLLLAPLWLTTCVLTAAESAPAPAPLKVGCYYFPGFFDASRWTPIKAYGRPTPRLGFYRDGAPGVSDWHIAWATANGISFFVFDWYYNHRSGPNTRHNTALDQGFLAAAHRDAMEFALMWCNEEPAATPAYTPEEMLRLGRALGRYVREPNYLRVAGRPVLVISRPGRLVASFGPGFRELIPQISEAAGLPAGTDLFCVALGSAPEPLYRQMGFAATTAYNYASQRAAPHGSPLRASYDDMVAAYEAIWRRMTAPGELPYIVPVSPGWDSRPWYGPRAFVRVGSSPAAFRDLCQRARQYVDPRLNMVLAECWNEFGEGSFLEPCEETGFEYLHALREALAPGLAWAPEPVPTAAEKAQFTFATVPDDRRPASAGDQRGNLLADPDMEDGSGWVLHDGTPAPVAGTGAHRGSRCLELPPGKGCKPVRPVLTDLGRPYRLSVWVRCAPGARAEVRAATFGTGGQWLGDYLDVGNGGGPAWTEVSRVVRIADPRVVALNVEVVAAGGTVWLDDAALCPAGPATPPEVLLKVASGDAAAWCTFAGGEPATARDAAAGVCVLSVRPGEGVKTRQHVTVKPGDALRFRVRLCCDGMATATLRAACFDAGGQWIEGAYLDVGAFSWQEWIDIPGQVCVPADSAAASVNVECTAAGGTVHLAEVRVERP